MPYKIIMSDREERGDEYDVYTVTLETSGAVVNYFMRLVQITARTTGVPERWSQTARIDLADTALPGIIREHVEAGYPYRTYYGNPTSGKYRRILARPWVPGE